jgi:mRNA-degrading endonuclease RelE of RelBE toxin-antitoxin system
VRARATPKFWKIYAGLPQEVQQQARKAYLMWKANPNHPSLRFKRVDEQEPIYSARVSGDYRVLGVLEGDTVVWFWIGDHKEYERLLKG